MIFSCAKGTVLWFKMSPLSFTVRAGSQSIAELKTLMEEVSTLKAEREVIVTTLKDPVTDISKWS